MNSESKRILLSKGIDNYFIGVYNAYRFVLLFFKEVFKSPFHIREIINQCFEVGLKSLPLITLTGFITGMVFTKQSRSSLETFGATSWLPSLISIAIVRALASLVTALICAGKIGSSIGAELGSMKVTEQIDAMEVSGTNPYKYLVATRVLATTLMLPVLTILGDAVSLFGAYIGVNLSSVTSLHFFFTQVFHSLSFSDILPAIAKTFFFGFAVGIVGCYKGFNSSKGTQGVGVSANSAVVLSSVLIFIIDLLAVQFTNMLGLN